MAVGYVLIGWIAGAIAAIYGVVALGIGLLGALALFVGAGTLTAVALIAWMAIRIYRELPDEDERLTAHPA